ncbi:MAG: hypothetical protein KA368_02300 [Acidobacteria bacterium]|nr:hypothetical protein [Acidobacteriota bacterium]
MKKIVIEAGRGVPAGAGLLLKLVTLLAFTFTTVSATDSNNFEYQGAGVWLSQEKNHLLSTAHEEELLQSLRKITGLCELRFTENGSLNLGDTSDQSDGSLIARSILRRALESGYVFVVEDHSDSTDVNFGQMDEGTNYEEATSQRRFLIWKIRLDFDDFRKMAASRGVRESFNIGFTFLHELLHGLGHKDAEQIQELGECEELINQARLELSLPTRDQYFGVQVKITERFFTVRLKFRDHARRRDEYMFFMAPPGSQVVEIVEGVVRVKK